MVSRRLPLRGAARKSASRAASIEGRETIKEATTVIQMMVAPSRMVAVKEKVVAFKIFLKDSLADWM